MDATCGDRVIACVLMMDLIAYCALFCARKDRTFRRDVMPDSTVCQA
ncbi:hypothetical protein [Acetobacter sicerae]|nr:hypothetical protein [Acetobacter sicerae]NHN92429.1 hypothetical protein [Acetobacter sicerae]